MMTVTKTATMVLFLACNAAAQPKWNEHPLQSYVLTDQMIAEAIEEGQNKDKFETMGLLLKDSLSWINRGGNKQISTGFSVEIYTPYTWVGQQARWAARRGEDFRVEDLTKDMVENVLHVVANPDLPSERPGASRRGTSGVDHVIIRSTAEQDFDVLQPIAIEESLDYPTYGRPVPYARKTAVFDLQQVAEICMLDKKGEFFVVVIGTTDEEKTFRVRTKHFERLR